MKSISILVPCYNEEAVLPLFIDSIVPIMANTDYRWQLLLIDDGSTDRTLQIMCEAHQRDPRIEYIELSRNYGKETALQAGIDYVAGDAVVIMDADLQHPVSVIPEMIEKWESGFDDVYACRITRGKESWIRKVLTKCYYRLLQSVAQTNVYPNVGDFRLLDRCCINALRSMKETNRYTKGMYGYIGFKKTYVDFEQQERIAGQSKWNYHSLFKLALNGLLSSTTLPLKLSTYLGLIVSLTAFVYMLYVLLKAALFGDPVQGFPTLMVTILFLGGVQLLSLGIIGEYIGRIFTESKKRPNYFVRTYNGKKAE